MVSERATFALCFFMSFDICQSKGFPRGRTFEIEETKCFILSCFCFFCYADARYDPCNPSKHSYPHWNTDFWHSCDADPAWSMRYFQRFWDEPSKSKKQKVMNILVFASFTMKMLDMTIATLANTDIRIGTPISGLVEMPFLPGRCVTSRDSAVPVTS